jgi:hypothetical protein
MFNNFSPEDAISADVSIHLQNTSHTNTQIIGQEMVNTKPNQSLITSVGVRTMGEKLLLLWEKRGNKRVVVVVVVVVVEAAAAAVAVAVAVAEVSIIC